MQAITARRDDSVTSGDVRPKSRSVTFRATSAQPEGQLEAATFKSTVGRNAATVVPHLSAAKPAAPHSGSQPPDGRAPSQHQQSGECMI